MPSVYPDFYERFACRADRCRHSCCRGWEIDVDAASAAYYRALPGPLGEELRAALYQDAEGWHFRLDERERCPLLRGDGLCRLIAALGEDALCDICALHPRFFADCGAFELCGIGLSCEAAAALLLESDTPLGFVTEGARIGLPALLERLGHPVPETALRFAPPTNRAYFEALLKELAETEPIDMDWPRELAALEQSLEGLLSAVADYAGRCDRACYDRIFGYILYRQLDRLETVPLPALLDYARRCTAFIFLQDAGKEDTAEHLRRWSEQIEYSTENVELLLKKQRR